MVHSRNGNTRIIGLLLGLVLLMLCVSGVSAADPAVNITVTKWNIPPLAPTNFQITQTALDAINITWTMGTAANITIVRGSTSGYPFSVLDGDAVYSGNLTYVEVSGLDLDANTYYYRAWSQNEYGTSSGYAEDSIGSGAGTTTATTLEGFGFFTFVFLALGMTGGWIWSRLRFVAYGAAGAWALLAFFSLQESTSTNPTQITDIYMALFWLSIAFVMACALLPTVMRERAEPDEYPTELLDEAGDDLSGIMTMKPKEEEPRIERASKFAQSGKLA